MLRGVPSLAVPQEDHWYQHSSPARQRAARYVITRDVRMLIPMKHLVRGYQSLARAYADWYHVTKFLPKAEATIRNWFRMYKTADGEQSQISKALVVTFPLTWYHRAGKPENTFAFDGAVKDKVSRE